MSICQNSSWMALKSHQLIKLYFKTDNFKYALKSANRTKSTEVSHIKVNCNTTWRQVSSEQRHVPIEENN